MMIDKRQVLFGLLAAPALQMFALPGVSFAADVIRIPIEVTYTGVPVIAVMINGKGPYRFVLNTSTAFNIIDTALAQTLGLAEGRKVPTTAGPVVSYKATEMIYGSAVRQSETFLVGKTLYDKFDGAIPASLLTSFPSELDYSAKEIRIYTSAAPDQTGFTPLKASFRPDEGGGSDKLYATITIDGLTMKMAVNTSAENELRLYGDTVQHFKLWDKYAPFREFERTNENPDSKDKDVVKKTRLVTMPNFVFAPGLTLDSLPVTLMEPAPMTGGSLQGIIGARLLKSFTLSFNKAKGVLAVKANADFVPPKLNP
jgi:hypothetical protein